MADPTAGFEVVEGVRTRVLRGGEGPPLVFLHGANGARWLPFMDKLAARFEVIAPEHPGFGLSDTPDWLDSVRDLGHFYQAFMEKLGLSDVTLVGTSLGGWIAAETALRNQARLRALVLAASAGVRVKGVRKGDLFLWSQEELTRNLVHDPALAEKMLAAPLTEEDRNIGLKNRLMTARLAWSPRLCDPELEKWLHRIATPTLVLWGREDKLIPVVHAQRFEELLPQARVRVFDGCGHLPHVEKTDAYVGEIIAFAEGARP
jgi:pimeloyl-ACP methyl ester carboxylesterase